MFGTNYYNLQWEFYHILNTNTFQFLLNYYEITSVCEFSINIYKIPIQTLENLLSAQKPDYNGDIVKYTAFVVKYNRTVHNRKYDIINIASK